MLELLSRGTYWLSVQNSWEPYEVPTVVDKIPEFL